MVDFINWSRVGGGWPARVVEQFVRAISGLGVIMPSQVSTSSGNQNLASAVAELNRELAEARDHQAATSEILGIISSSPADVLPVFETLINSAVKLCKATRGFVARFDGEVLRFAAGCNVTPELRAYFEQNPFAVDRHSNTGRAALERRTIHNVDVQADPEYTYGGAQVDPYRTVLAIPMLKANDLLGVILIYRYEVLPFTSSQIALIETFAAQAVIAIENTRLLDELNKLNHQRRSSESGQVGEIERMSRLRRFLPPQVADLIVTSGTEKQLESHRREITALFCDLRGFTGFSESSDPEDVMSLLRDYHEAIGQIIIKYSGTLERYAGDGVMVIFNDPVPVCLTLRYGL